MPQASILIIDDEPDIREVVSDILKDEDYQTTTAESAEAARELVKEQAFDLILLDIWLPGDDGLTLLKEWSSAGNQVPVIMISGHGTVETAVEALKYGAYDFIEKPLRTAKLLVTIERALDNIQLVKENLRLREKLKPDMKLIGNSRPITELKSQISRIAATDSWVLITGEAGSGKLTAAHTLHCESSRSDGPFIEVSLAAAPTQNLAIELFGAEQEDEILPGRFEEARGGTLYLHEIADLNVEAQIKLVSALDEGRFRRIGGSTSLSIDSRIIASTNRDLAEAVTSGRFREELYYRLNVVPLSIPPLRTHLDDLPDLVAHYISTLVELSNLTSRRFSKAAFQALLDYNWPGNALELKNLVQRLLILGKGPEIGANEVLAALQGKAREYPEVKSEPAQPENYNASLRDARDDFERHYFLYHLQKTGGNVSEVAQEVGLERTHLYRKLKSLGIDPKASRQETDK